MTSDMCERARIAYDLGIDPIDYAEAELAAVVGVHLSLAGLCADLDLQDGPLTVRALCRRILGSLLDAGWTAPEVTE